MSELVLKALMRLFAIIANVDDVEISDKSRNIVKSFLKKHLNEDLLSEYLVLFEEYYQFHHNFKKHTGSHKRERFVSNSVKVITICDRISAELRLKQKIYVITQLLEFIRYGEEANIEKKLEFIKSVTSFFAIDINVYNNLQEFIFLQPNQIVSKENIMLIANEGVLKQYDFKNIISNQLQGYIVFLKLDITSMYLFKYIGNDTLYLNSHTIISDRVYVMVNGSSIRSSKITPIYYSDIIVRFLDYSNKPKIVFEAKDVEYTFKNGVKGINKFSFSEVSGKMIGIMGNSGTGKSTLLNLFNGNLKPQTGSITINGLDIHKDKEKTKGIIGYIPQDDLLIEELTVFENLYFNAKLCFGNYSESQINKIVIKVLKNLGLHEIRDLKVGNPLNKLISGGQRKRLNIALELLRESDVLFIDEPTSGLSSADSDIVMDLLKELSLNGKLIISIIHQPSSEIFKLFDKLIIIDKGGYIIYQGDPIDAISYFRNIMLHVNPNEIECSTCGNVNPEQILQIIETKIINEYGNPTPVRKILPAQWHKYYIDNIESKLTLTEHSESLPKINVKVPSKIKQLYIYLTRDIFKKIANTQYLLINFLEAPILAFILAFLTKYTLRTTVLNEYVFSENKNLPAYLYMSIVVA